MKKKEFKIRNSANGQLAAHAPVVEELPQMARFTGKEAEGTRNELKCRHVPALATPCGLIRDVNGGGVSVRMTG